MTTGAIFAQGTLLKMGDGGGGGEIFTTIAEARTIKGPTLSRKTIDVTTHDSTGGFAEYMGALADGGNVTFEINYIMTNATHNATNGLISKLQNNTRTNFKLVFTDGGATTWSLSGFVIKFDPEEPVNDVAKAAVEIKISGKPTLV